MKNKLIYIYFFIASITIGQSKIKTLVEGSYTESRSYKAFVTSKELSYEVTKELSPFLSVPSITLLSNGNSLLIHRTEGQVEFYNNKGNLISQKRLYELPPHNEQKILSDNFSDGCFILVSETNNNRCYSYSNNGAELSVYDLHNGNLNSFGTSPDGNLLVYSYYNWYESQLDSVTVLLDLKKNEEYFFSFLTDRVIFRNPDLFLLTNRKEYFLLNNESREIAFSKKLYKGIIIDADLDSTKIIGLEAENVNYISGQWIFQNLSIVEINLNGKKNILNRFQESTPKIKLKKTGVKWELTKE